MILKIYARQQSEKPLYVFGNTSFFYDKSLERLTVFPNTGKEVFNCTELNYSTNGNIISAYMYNDNQE